MKSEFFDVLFMAAIQVFFIRSKIASQVYIDRGFFINKIPL